MNRRQGDIRRDILIHSLQQNIPTMEEKLLAGDTNDRHLPPPCCEKPLDAEDFLALVFFAILAVFTVCFFYSLLTTDFSTHREPEVSVTVDRASGLDSSRVQRAFNLTLRIDNVGVNHEECVGGEAVVLYGGVPLAAGVVRDLCVPSNGTGQVAVFAGSGGVGLPTELAELIADEKLDGGGAVQLEVRVISLKYRFLRCAAATNLHGGTAEPLAPCKRLFLRDESDGVQQMIDIYQ